MKVKGIFTVKLCLVFLFQVIFVDIVKSQNDSLPSIDKSPLDISYCPPFFPIQKAQNKINIPEKSDIETKLENLDHSNIIHHYFLIQNVKK